MSAFTAELPEEDVADGDNLQDVGGVGAIPAYVRGGGVGVTVASLIAYW